MHPKRWLLALALGFFAAGTAAGDESSHAGRGMTTVGDARAPLRLTAMMAEHQKRTMRDHLAAVGDIVGALGRDDLQEVARQVPRIGYSDGMAQMCSHLGAATPGFTDLALTFHRTADAIGEAARRDDRAGALAALHRTLQACVTCHAGYRQEIVDEATWRRLTDAPKAP